MNPTNKLKLTLTGLPTTPKLYSALQIAYGLVGNWESIVVIGSSSSDGKYQHLGGYSTLHIAKDATPQRYAQLLNIAASCKEVLILSGLSDEWQHGVLAFINTNGYEDQLAAHRMLFHTLRHLPVHVICCIDTRQTFLQKDETGRRKLRVEQVVQQLDVAQHFTTVLRVNKRGEARVEKDGTQVLPTGETPIKLSPQTGRALMEWCRSGDSLIAQETQERIDRCTSLAELYRLLFEMDVDDPEIMNAFTKRKLALDTERTAPILQTVTGGLF